MLVLAAAIALQTPLVSLRQIWTVGPTFEDNAVTRDLGVLTHYKESRTFRFLGQSQPTSSPEKMEVKLFELDTLDGRIVNLSTLEEFHKRSVVDSDITTYSLTSDGELLREHLDGTNHTVTLIDPLNVAPKIVLTEKYNQFFEFKDSSLAATNILFPGKFLVDGLGETKLLHDGVNCRLVSIAGEVHTLTPHTWDTADVLVSHGDLSPKGELFMDAQLVGDPEDGPFAISNGVPPAAAAAYFNTNQTRLDIPKEEFPLDAGAHGFLVSKGIKTGLECYDGQTGNLKWTRKDLAPLDATAHWVGQYAVCFGRKAFDTKGKIVRCLEVLDADTGKTQRELVFPMLTQLWEASGLPDVVILRDEHDRLFGYRIVVK
jgi:hypothetical protein